MSWLATRWLAASGFATRTTEGMKEFLEFLEIGLVEARSAAPARAVDAAHACTGPACEEPDSLESVRSTENEPAPRIMRNTSMASAKR